MPAFLLTNDTRAQAHLEKYGQKHFDDALSKALSDAKRIVHASDCEQILDDYLGSWRHGHLRVVATERLEKKDKQKKDIEESAQPDDTTATQPTIEFFSVQTVLLTLPGFAATYEKTLARLLEDNHDKLGSTPNWIIDVRQNGGGSDSNYYPLLPWIMQDEWAEIGMEWLVTPANSRAQEQICRRFAPESKDCSEQMDKVVSLMKSAATGQYIKEDGEAITYKLEKPVEPRRPQRVGILIDKNCASSCEQFLLTVRQSYSVKLLGRRTYGALDYSNLRLRALPSDNYELYYATSRSLRLPDLPVDIACISPDLYLAKPNSSDVAKSEIMQVKNWIEGGSLANTEE